MDEEEDDENSGLSESPGQEDDQSAPVPEGQPGKYIHGMCEVVDIKLDNQKLTEQTWSMNDFLDSESDDPTDDDWELTGDKDINDDQYAW